LCLREERDILVRTSFDWYLQKLWEKLRILRFVIKRKMTREKPIVWDEESMKEADGLDDEESFTFTGPNFNPAVTALFSTDYAHPLHLISRRGIREIREKVQKDCRFLVELGYTDFVSNYGDKYGMIALSELVHLKKTLYPHINLYYGKLYSEHARCFTSLDLIRIVMACNAHGVECVGSMHACKFIEKVVWRASHLSYERGLMGMDKAIPVSMLTHFAIWLIERYRDG